MPKLEKLSRREKEILELLFRLGEASAKDVQAHMANAPGNSSVRTHLKNLVLKGYVNLKESGLKYVYSPAQDINEVSNSALSDVIDTFFQGEPVLAVNQLISGNLDEISDEDLRELEKMIREHRTRKK
ncbi:MAG: BlaI/MecI/CopY family transcriptional regulator [Pseudomonadales bacterium]|nr:BlaI/MecI/CopY family transcriptional regulator [Pseudomonadales bacterium]